MAIAVADPDPTDRQPHAVHGAAEAEAAGARGLEVDSVDRAVVREPVGEREAVGAQGHRVTALETDGRRGYRRARDDAAREHEARCAPMRDPEVPAVRVVPE